MKTISLHRLKTILENLTHATPVTFTAVTDARCRKRNNPLVALGPVYKVARVNGMANTSHENAVNRQMDREGNEACYQMGERSWGVRRGALVEREGEFYLPVQLHPTARVHPIFVAPKIRGVQVRLMPVSKEEVAPFLPSDRREAVAAQQGVERPVIRRDYKLTSLATITLNGERYRVRAD